MSSEAFRLTAWFGPHAPGREAGVPGEDAIDRGAIDVDQGGSAIPYRDEDPHVRKEFNEEIDRAGVVSRMEDSFYKK